MRTLTVSERGQEIPAPKEDGSGEGDEAMTVAIAQIPHYRDGQVLGDLGRDGDGIDLELVIAEPGEQKRTVERKSRDRPGTKTGGMVSPTMPL